MNTKEQIVFNVGDKVLIAPDITHEDEWIEGVVVEVEQNPFVGIVITAETKDHIFYFEKQDLFKKA